MGSYRLSSEENDDDEDDENSKKLNTLLTPLVIFEMSNFES